MKILMCIPYTGYIPPQAAYSLPAMACYARSKGIDIDMLPIGLSLVYIARETAAKTFLEGNYDALLFVDSDMVCPIDLLVRLVEADKDIVSGLAFKRFPPYDPCIFKKCDRGNTQFWYDYPKGLIEIQGAGMACTLIKREVFEKTPKPWFFPEPNLGEDLAFCVRAKEHGFKIYCDTNLVCGHCATEIITEAHYLKWNEMNTKDWWEKEHTYNWVNEGINGIEQTTYFADVLLNNLDIQLCGDVLDYGCALGQMTKALSEIANVTGYDYSKTAIEQAKKLYPNLTFTSELPTRQFDIVVSSNVLEHYHAPVEEMRNQLKLAKDCFIAMMPYRDGPHRIHPSRIDENSLPEEIDGFKRESVKIVPTTNPNLCYCPQIIFVYRRVV